MNKRETEIYMLKDDVSNFKKLTYRQWKLILSMNSYELIQVIRIYDRCHEFITNLIMNTFDFSNNSISRV